MQFALFKRRHKHHGQAMVEFVFSSLVFLTLVFLMIQFFLIVHNQATLESAARFAIQEAVKFKFPDEQQQAESRARDKLESYLLSIGFLRDMDKVKSSVKIDGTEIVSGIFQITRIRMDVEYDMDLIFPLPSSKLGLQRTIKLTSTVKSISEHIREL